MRHHVGGTHEDGYGHGHERGPSYTVDLHTSLQRHSIRKGRKKAARVARRRARKVGR